MGMCPGGRSGPARPGLLSGLFSGWVTGGGSRWVMG
ncbi:rCG40304, partial [Rattus norvegicus]